MDSDAPLLATEGVSFHQHFPHPNDYEGHKGTEWLQQTGELDLDTSSPGHEGDALAIDLGAQGEQHDSTQQHTQVGGAEPVHSHEFASPWEENGTSGASWERAEDAMLGGTNPGRADSHPSSLGRETPPDSVDPSDTRGNVLPGVEKVQPGAAALVAAQEQGKKKSHARKQPKGHIPRPRNAFILFRKHITDNNLIPTTVEVKHQNVSVIASKMWAEAPPEVKAEFVEAARIEKEEHARKYPNYRYQPAYRRTDIIRRRVRKDPDEEEKCEAVASLLMEGKVGKKLEVEIGQVIAKTGEESAGPAKKGRRRKDAPGELSKGALRAQRAQARAKALRENWLETTVLAANQHQQAVLHAEQERMYQQMQQQQMMDGYAPHPLYMAGEPMYDPYGAPGGYHDDPYHPDFPPAPRYPGTHDVARQPYYEAYGPQYPDAQMQMGAHDQAYLPHTPLNGQDQDHRQRDMYIAPGHARTTSHQSRAPMQQQHAPQEDIFGADPYGAAEHAPWQMLSNPFDGPQHQMLTPHGTHHFEDAQMMGPSQAAVLESHQFPPEPRTAGGPADLIAGAWQQEQQPAVAPQLSSQPQPEESAFLPLFEGDGQGPAQDIDFGDKGELFGGMLGLRDPADGIAGLDDYQQALRHQEELELGLHKL